MKVVQEMLLFRSLLRSFADGNSRETIRHFVSLVLSVMHVLCVAHVQSVRPNRVTCIERANVFFSFNMKMCRLRRKT